jgi:hypothetical protein
VVWRLKVLGFFPSSVYFGIECLAKHFAMHAILDRLKDASAVMYGEFMNS